jgi:hypothetical protein
MSQNGLYQMSETTFHGVMSNNNTEEARHKAEVRQVLRWRVQDRNKAINYIELVRKRRGDKMANALHKDSADQWIAGNRGLEGDWK